MSEAEEYDTALGSSGPTNGASATKPKRRSRMISNLTRQQAQHKRDQDRRAQRALRQRNKDRIESLEIALSRLSSSHAEEAAARDDRLRTLVEENRQLQARVEQLSGHGTRYQSTTVTPPAFWASPPADIPPLEGQSPWDHGWAASPNITTRQQESRYDPIVDCSRVDVAAQATGEYQRSGINAGMALPDASQSPAVERPASSAVPTVHAALPNHLPPTCALDHILLGFLRFHSNTTSKEVAKDLAGPAQISLKLYLHPELTENVNPISRLMNEVLSTFSHVRAPEKISFMYLMHRTMRWQIFPTETTYSDLPRWLRPTATQVIVPHAAWIDNIPWPSVRDMLIENPEKYPFTLFSTVYSQCVTVNWPYDATDAITEAGDDFVPNKIFEKHIQRLGNWTVSRDFEEHYPEMVQRVYSRD
ncbi:hypothetical protein B0T11DRAFT_279439 [Plectosphaerella cucumerina]|uniref:BZIP transcription factor n=1 Tax=Plectosphaerella cucumerina TaxID=40658 RepID=A0A8K0X316_9PEZI|nr:hypothetical protein B0T11DRAFT_279439 [Plectosphaerella cucumerina]